MCSVVAERMGRSPEDLEVRALCMGVLGALMEASLYWAENDYRDDLADIAVRCLDALQQGLAP
jgi:hypothetical protein